MPLRDILPPDDALIDAALEAALNQPLAELLAIAEFAEKCGHPAAAPPAEESPEPAEIADVLALPEPASATPTDQARRAA